MSATTQLGVGAREAGAAGVARAPARGRWGALGVVCLATAMLAIDFMAVSVTLPATGHGTGASFDQLQWALEGPLIAVAALVLMAGRIADAVGRRPVFLVGIAVFGLGALVAGLARSPYVLIGGRVVEGVGAAALFSTGSLLLAEAFAGAASRLALATWAAVTGAALAASPYIGGVVTANLGWRWLYLLEVPVAALATLGGLAFVREPEHKARVAQPARGDRGARRPRADWVGLALLSAALTILVLGLVRTTTPANLGNFTQNGVIACFVCTFLLLGAFVIVEMTAPTPLLEMSLFRRRTFAGSSIAAFGLAMAVLGPFFFLVLYLSYDLGYSSLIVGERLLLLTAITLPVIPLSALLDRFLPAKLLISGGLVLVALGLWLMSRLEAAHPWQQLAPGLLVAGAGLELVSPRLALAAAAAVKPRSAALASRTVTMFRQLGTSVGVATFGVVLATRLADDTARALLSTPGKTTLDADAVANLALQGHVTAAGAAGHLAGAVQANFRDALHEVLLVAAVVAAASAVVALVVRSRDIPRRGRQSLPAEPVSKPQPVPRQATLEPVLLSKLSKGAGTTGKGSGEASGEGWETSSKGAEVHDEGAEMTDEGAAEGAGEQEVPTEAPDAGVRASEERAFDPLVDTPPRGAPAIVLPGAVSPPVVPPLEPVTPIATAEQPAGASAAPEEDVRPERPHPAAVAPRTGLSLRRLLDFRASFRPRMPETTQGTAPEAPSRPGGEQSAPAGTRGQATSGQVEVKAEALEVKAEALAVKAEEVEVKEEFIDLTGGRSLRGKVTDNAGNTLPGATVTLVSPEGHEAAHAVSGEDGSFSWSGLAGHTYTLVATAPSFRASAIVVPLRSGAEVRATLSLLGVGSVAGKVTRARGGAPLGAEVELVNGQGTPVLVAEAGADGQFELSDVVEGDYELVATAAGFGAQRLSVSVRRGQALVVDVPMTGVGYLYGAVVSGGAWVPDMPVKLKLTDGPGAVVAATSTDSAGSYHFSGVPEGRYSVIVASAPGEDEAVISVVDIDAGQTIAADLTLQVP
ncbi:MAG TPA: MFS transporter [Acidimicrobiales bacterium]|nr:MFS transporter [Acidimicrobiales bacterium]